MSSGLFINILNMSLTASYVVLAVIVIRLFLKKAPKIFSYALWSAVLIRLVIPFSFSSAFSFLSFLNPNIQNARGAINYIADNIGLMQNPAVDTGVSSINNAVNSVLPAATQTASVNSLQAILAIVGTVWLIGMAVLLIYSAVSYLKVIRRVKTATLIKDNIFETDRIDTAFLCGFIKPKIYVPLGLCQKDLANIVAHEQTHIRRRDYLIKPFAFLVLIVHWFNPIIWLAFVLMTKDMEMSCDESVIKKMGDEAKGGYSNSLLSLSVKTHTMLMGSPLAFGESNVKSRIKNVLSYKKPAFWVIVVAIIATVLLIFALTSNPKNEEAALSTGEYLLSNQTEYVGNNSKVCAIIYGLTFPAELTRQSIELETSSEPYGVKVNFVTDTKTANYYNDEAKQTLFLQNAIIMFSLIDNVSYIDFNITDDKNEYVISYARETADSEMGKDVRLFADSQADFDAFLEEVKNIGNNADGTKTTADIIEENLAIIMSSPQTSSNPYDYINAHPKEYQNILNIGDEADSYLVKQLAVGDNNNLRGHIMSALYQALLEKSANQQVDSVTK